MTPQDLASPAESEALNRRYTVFDHLPDGVMVTTLEGVIIDWNRSAEQMFGWSREEAVGKTPAILHGAEDAAVLTDSINSAATRSGRWFGEIRFIRKDGTSGVCETTTTPLRDAEGTVFATLGVNHDITARKRVEGRLIEEGRVLRTLIDALPDQIFFKDREGRYLLHNKSEQRRWKLNSEELIGRTVFEIPGVLEHAAAYHADDMAVISTGEPIIEREEPFATPTGEEGWFLTSKYPLCDASGEIIGLVGISRDITKSKAVEGRLAEERSFLQTLIDAIPDLIFFKDREGRHVHINAADRILFGVTDDVHLGKTIHEWPIPRELADQYAADDLQVLSTGEPMINREEPYERADGTRGWFLTTKLPLRDEHGVITGLLGIARDVTEIKLAAEKLEQTQQRLVDHIDNSPLAVIEWDRDFRVERWSGRSESIFGWAPEEVLGRRFVDWEFVHPEDDVKVREVGARLLDGRDQRNTSRNWNLAKDGTVVHCVWQNSVLRGSDGEIVSIFSLVQDVTDQFIAEQTIRDNERLYHTMVQATNTGYVQMNSEGRVIEANSEYLRLTGRKELSDITGHFVAEWTAPSDAMRLLAALQECTRSGLVRNVELEYVSADKQLIPIEFTGCSVHLTAGMRIIGFCRDITQRREAEAERKAMERKLQEAQKLESLGVLAGGIAHDFNNLLTGVLGNASLAATELGGSSPVKPYLEQIETAAMRAAELCKQMLAYSGKGRFVVQRLNLNAVINETTNLLQISISKNAVLKLTLPAGLPSVMADVTQIRQIVMNLVINASEALSERSGLISLCTGVVRIDPAYLAETHLSPDLPEGDYVFLEVADNGVGMAPDVQTRIFDPFFSTKFTGRGLGLAAVLGIVRGHKGALKVYSEPGRGTTFKVLLPCADGPAEELQSSLASTAEWRGVGAVLIIDDEETVRVTSARMFEVLGFQPILAHNGEMGLECFNARRSEIVLTVVDLTMPRMEGDEVFREIRRIQPEARVMLMSGFNEQDAVSRFLGKGLAGFIQKPFRIGTLREKLQQIFAIESGTALE